MSIREIRFQVRVIVDQDDGLFHAFTPDIRGLHACGESQQEALAAINEASTLYFQSLMKHGESLPVGLVTLDREHPGILHLIWTLLVERFSGRKRHSETAEIVLPTNGNFAHC